jgi:putative ABC transport system permease protein
MALGIGATTAVFSIVRGVLLTPLPYREPNRLVLFRADLPGYHHEAALTGTELFALRDRSDLFESVAVINESEGNLTSPEDMEAVTAASISDNFFQTLGVSLILGRSITHQDFGKGFVNGVDISYELWERRFQRDPNIVGRAIEVNNIPMRVAGVLPRDFRLYLGAGVPVPPRVDVFYPRGSGYDTDPFRGQIVIARLGRDVTLGAARTAVDALASRAVAEHPSSYRTGAVRLSLSTLDQDVVSDVKPALTALAGAVGFVLLVACANLTNLLLARASARSRELAVRISIGASRRHIVGQLAAEGLVVGVLGAVGGLLIAQWSVDGLLLLAPATLPRREAIGMDLTVASFAIIVALLCALAVSLVPAWQATKPDAGRALKQDPVSSRSANTMRGLLAASQLALSLVLLVGAGLLGRAFISMRAVPLGFNPDRVLTMNIALQGQRFGSGSLEEARVKRLVFYHQLADSVRQTPGVEQVGVGLPVPLNGLSMIQRYSTGPTDTERQAEGVIALAGYLETLRVPLVAGRYFTVADDDQPVVILDQRLAGGLWPAQSAIGRRLLVSRVKQPQWVEVVGVVAHVQTQDVRRPGLPQLWMTYATRSYAGLTIVVRGPNPMAFVPGVKEAVQRLGAGRPVHDIRLLNEYVADASADTRFALFVLGAFAALALILTAIGMYAVVAYATARRTREIAVRLALGADARRIVVLVMRQGAIWIGVGLVAGIAGARLLTRYVAALLFNVTETDAMTFWCVAAGLATVALMASAIPALRAVKIDPMLSLRAE